MSRLRDKVAMVTGGATGLGKATALLFAKEGAKVVVADINQEQGLQTVEEINHNGGQALFVELDVTKKIAWENAMKMTLKTFEKINILINNAGVGLANNIEETSLDEWNLVMSVNATGVFLGTQSAIKHMKDNGEKCSIVNRSSIDGLIGESGLFAYCASKGAVTVQTKAAALHCGEKGYTIRVNSVHPGYIQTEMVEEEAKGYGITMEEYAKSLGANIPIGHIGEPLDIAYIDLYLASDESKLATGAEFVIDGGWTAQ